MGVLELRHLKPSLIGRGDRTRHPHPDVPETLRLRAPGEHPTRTRGEEEVVLCPIARPTRAGRNGPEIVNRPLDVRGIRFQIPRRYRRVRTHDLTDVLRHGDCQRPVAPNQAHPCRYEHGVSTVRVIRTTRPPLRRLQRRICKGRSDLLLHRAPQRLARFPVKEVRQLEHVELYPFAYTTSARTCPRRHPDTSQAPPLTGFHLRERCPIPANAAPCVARSLLRPPPPQQQPYLKQCQVAEANIPAHYVSCPVQRCTS
mmetsp:Transcript_30132/g.84170  ORF Transcript_30132/g.84170 Transcript_30132/m.84170 type:complete len:257 (+) Transcript_30132:5910-6680(+)